LVNSILTVVVNKAKESTRNFLSGLIFLHFYDLNKFYIHVSTPQVAKMLLKVFATVFFAVRLKDNFGQIFEAGRIALY